MEIKPSKPPFGYLFTLDLYDCKEGVCDDLTLCYNFLIDITNKLKMHSQSPPFIFRSDQVKYPDKAGLSGWIPLIESGIQIHTLTEENFISIDVYSCRKFSTDDIATYVKDYFGCGEVEQNFIERGVNYHERSKQALAK